MLLISIVPPVNAGFVGSEPLTVTVSGELSDLEKIQAVLENKIVRQRLEQLGFTSEEVNARVSQLSVAEIHTLAQNLDQLKVGAFHGWVFWIGVAAIVAVVLVLIGVLKR
jgi:hypothetical protein